MYLFCNSVGLYLRIQLHNGYPLLLSLLVCYVQRVCKRLYITAGITKPKAECVQYFEYQNSELG